MPKRNRGIEPYTLSEHKSPPEVIESMLKAKTKYEPVGIYTRVDCGEGEIIGGVDEEIRLEKVKCRGTKPRLRKRQRRTGGVQASIRRRAHSLSWMRARIILLGTKKGASAYVETVDTDQAGTGSKQAQHKIKVTWRQLDSEQGARHAPVEVIEETEEVEAQFDEALFLVVW